jgi:hypothetical protein
LKGQQEARGWDGVDIEVATRVTIGMVLAIALLDDWLFGRGKRRPSRKRILNELAAFQLFGAMRRR